MTYLENITADDLRQILAEVKGKTATQWVMAGIVYKDGVTQTTIESGIMSSYRDRRLYRNLLR